MAAPPGWLPDWRDTSAYRFERLDRAGFAWEWLRRDPGYQDAASGTGAHQEWAGPAAARWGLVRLERAELAAPEARPLWRADADREVLAADIVESALSTDGALWLDGFGDLLTFAVGEGAAHLLLSDGWRRVRIDLHGRFDAHQRLLPRWRLAGVQLQPQVLALRRLVSIVGSGRFANRLWPRDPRARRWILALRAHDALAAGAGQRALAKLLGGEPGAGHWRAREPSIRLQAQRLAGLARRLPGRAFADRHLAPG